MDGISSIILASTFGVGVLFSIFPMFLFQGGITILVFYYSESKSQITFINISYGYRKFTRERKCTP